MEETNNQKILVVDDEKVVRDLVAKILRSAGHDVEAVDSGRTALLRMKTDSFDMIVTDMKMPDMNGFQLLKEIKRDFPEVAVVIMTAHSDTYTIKDALIFGADEYITKPFKQQEVVVVVERALWRRESARRQ